MAFKKEYLANRKTNKKESSTRERESSAKIQKYQKKSSHQSSSLGFVDRGLSFYLQKIYKIPTLTPEEERKLALSYAREGSVESAQRLVLSHLRIVPKLASKYRNYGLSMMDMIAEGNIGLMQAVKHFDISKGFRLVTYATWWIKAAIQDYIFKSWSLVRITKTAVRKRLFFNLRRAKAKLISLSGYDPGRKTNDSDTMLLAKKLSATPRDIEEMSAHMMGDISLDTNLGSEGSCTTQSNSKNLIDYLETENTKERPDVIVEKRDSRTYRRSLLARILWNITDKRLRFIIWARYLRSSSLTLEKLGLKYKVSRERVRQLEQQALKKIKEIAKTFLNLSKEDISSFLQ